MERLRDGGNGLAQQASLPAAPGDGEPLPTFVDPAVKLKTARQKIDGRAGRSLKSQVPAVGRQVRRP